MEETTADAGEQSELPRWIWLGIPPLWLASEVCVWLVAPEFHERWFNQRERPIDWLTPVVLLVGIWAGFKAWCLRHRLPARWLGTSLLLLTLGCIYFAGEEISWGQHVFGWETGQTFKAINRQGETNLHNISGWFNEKPRAILETWVLVSIFVILRRRRSGPSPSDWRYWVWPTAICLPTAVLAILTRVPDRVQKVFGEFDGQIWHDLRFSEQQELSFGFFLSLFLTSFYLRLRRLGNHRESAGSLS